MGEITNDELQSTHARLKRSPLLPDRSPADFFIPDMLDAAPKGDIAGMEHPLFTLSKKPDLKPRRYERGANFLEVTPSHLGLATVFDRDIIIYAISLIIAAKNKGLPYSKTVRLKAYDLLRATNRGIGGREYKLLREAFERLRGTGINTNITTGGVEVWETFGLIEHAKIIRETRDGRMLDVEVTLSEWIFNSIQANHVLTLHRDYFRLRKPLERRLYEIGRKHCGAQPSWECYLTTLQAKMGATSSLREFRRLIGEICRDDEVYGHMPDYAVRYDPETDKVLFQNKGIVRTRLAAAIESDDIPPLPPDTYEQAKRVAHGWDIYGLEQEWREWCAQNEIIPKHPARHFLKFCASHAERRGAA